MSVTLDCTNVPFARSGKQLILSSDVVDCGSKKYKEGYGGAYGGAYGGV
jgi:hypothetical protein